MGVLKARTGGKEQAMIDTFLFDIGNVLLDFDYLKEFRKLFDEETAQKIADISVRNSEVWREMDAGVLTYDEVISLIVRHAPHLESQIRLAIKELYDNVQSFDYAERWLKQLKTAGFRVYILSNYGEKPFAASKERMPFLKYTDGQLISYEIRQTKPSPIAFVAACERFGIDPDQTVFIDDSAANIAAASALGFHTVLFTGYEDALRALSTLPLEYSI